MPSVQQSLWWSQFDNVHGPDSEEHAAFLGYLTTQAIDPGSDDATLAAAYEAFRAFMEASYAGEGGGEPKTVTAPETDPALSVPRSKVGDPRLQKPMDAATRPPSFRRDAPPVAARLTSPNPGETSPPATEGTPGEGTQTSGEASEGGEGDGSGQRYGVRRR